MPNARQKWMDILASYRTDPECVVYALRPDPRCDTKFAPRVVCSQRQCSAVSNWYSKLVEQIHMEGLNARCKYGWSDLLPCFTALRTTKDIFRNAELLTICARARARLCTSSSAVWAAKRRTPPSGWRRCSVRARRRASQTRQPRAARCTSRRRGRHCREACGRGAGQGLEPVEGEKVISLRRPW